MVVDASSQMQEKKDSAISRLEFLTQEQLESLIDYLHNVIHIE